MKRPEGFDASARASRPAAPRTRREQPRGAGDSSSQPSAGAARKPGAQQNAPKPARTQRAGAQPTDTQPERAQPERAQPERAQPEGAQPERAQPEGARPASAKPAGAEPPRADSRRSAPSQPLGIRPAGARDADTAARGVRTSAAPGARTPKAGAPQTSARDARTASARKPHPPAPRGPNARPPVRVPGGADAEPERSRSRRPGVLHRAPSPEAEARRAARQRRRFERGEIRRFTRRSRNRRLAWMVGLLLVVAMFGGVAAAVFSPLFALSRIDIRGADRVDRGKVHAALEGQLGTPLALLDEGAIRRELGGFPLIRSFITELVPPDTLVIRITERQPVGAIPADGGFSLVDPAGVVVQSVQERPEGMPLIDVGDEDVPSTAYRSAAEVLLALPDDLAAEVDTVTARTKDDVTLVLAESDQRVVWGSAEQSELKARVLAALVAQMGDSGPGRYDVSAPLTAVFRED